jgi:energy-coupling factor transporter ATP-binding protein EcfA2
MSTLPTRSPSRRRGQPLDERELAAAAPFVSWSRLYGYLRAEFRQGDHVAIIGPTGTGKTHLALEVAELRSHVIVVACKPDDPLIDDARGRGYWLVPTDQLEIPMVERADRRGMRPLHPRVIYWPRLSERERRRLPKHRVMEVEKAHQRPRVGSAIGYVRNEKHWALVIDEGTWVCRDLRLQRDIDSALFQFRSLNASVIVLGQRPSWMGRYVLSSPTHLFLFSTNDGDDRKALGDVSGVDTRLVAELVSRLDLDAHEFLYLDTRRRAMFRSIAPAR